MKLKRIVFKSGKMLWKKTLSGFLCIAMLINFVAVMPISVLAETATENQPVTREATDYTIFSGNENEPFQLYGWKGNFNGNLYSSSNFICGLSEFFVDGRIDSVGSISTSGWMTNIGERNENVDVISMPDWDEKIHKAAGDYEIIDDNPAYIEDTTVISNGIKTFGDVTIGSTYFNGYCYIIADGNIVYNINDFQSTGRIVLYSRNGNITINGSNIDFGGIIYAPNGTVAFNSNIAEINGRIFADKINFSGSVFNVTGKLSDWDLLKPKYISKTYTNNSDFNEGNYNGLSIDTPDQLILSEGENNNTSFSKIFGDTEAGKGIKIDYSKSFVSNENDYVNISYGLSGFGDSDISENAVDLIIAVDESGSMSGARMSNAKAAAKEVVAKMKDSDRCAVIGFANSAREIQSFTDIKEDLTVAIDKLRASGGTNITSGLNSALSMFSSLNEKGRQKFIILLSDGEDSTNSANAALLAAENDIRIFALMVGTGSLQMQTIAINSNGIYKNAPQPEDVNKMMSYFALEVFNVAGRNSTFKTTVKDKNSVDISAISPEPSVITENPDGSITLEWKYERILIDEAKEITIPIAVSEIENGFADLTENTSCVYYDRQGKPSVIYLDDVSIPVSNRVPVGNWSVVYDSEQEDVNWSYIYWNGKRYGDSTVKVSASVSNDGVEFSEPLVINNYELLSELTGRYIKLDVDMTVSSDGKSPELFDITILSEGADAPIFANSEPEVSIISKDQTKVNYPLNIYAEISDDCLGSDLSVVWSCADSGAVFFDNTSLITTATFPESKVYEIVCTLTDGEHTISATKDITVEMADNYEDIDEEGGKIALPPEISANLPIYAERNQKIESKIEKLNDTEISWYSVIFNSTSVIAGDVDDEGNFTITIPSRDGSYKVIVRAFDWTGNSDTEEYTIIVDGSTPTISVVPSAKEVLIDADAFFTVTKTTLWKIVSETYTLNDVSVSPDENGIFLLDTSVAGTYTFKATATTNKGKTITSSAVIKVLPADTVKPTVKISPDKNNFYVGDVFGAKITATDNIGVEKIEAFIDGEEVEIDADGHISISDLPYGKYSLSAIAYDAAGNKGTATYTIDIRDNISPTVFVSLDQLIYFEGDTVTATVTATDNVEISSIVAKVNGETVPIVDGKIVIENTEATTYEINVTAYDPAGNSDTMTTVATVNKLTAPVIEMVFDKEIYHKGDTLQAFITVESQHPIISTVATVNGEEVSLEDGLITLENLSVGTYVFEVTAVDERNMTTTISETKTIVRNEEDTLISADVPGIIEYGDTAVLTITITDDIDPSTLAVTHNGEFVVLNSDYSYSFVAETLFENLFTVSAKTFDGEVIILNVESFVKDSIFPEIFLSTDKESYSANEDIIAYVKVQDNIGIKRTELTFDGKEYAIDENGYATIPSVVIKPHILLARTWDTYGNSKPYMIPFYVRDTGTSILDNEGDGKLNDVVFSPTDGQTITAPTPIIGTAAGTEFAEYKVEYAPVGTNDYTLLEKSNTHVITGVLGEIDPTLLKNGMYKIRTTVSKVPGGNPSTDKVTEIIVSVEGKMKIGNFSMSFQDVDVNVAGIPLTAIRTYDSRDKNINGDFGYGWNLSWGTDVKITKSCVLGENWNQSANGIANSVYSSNKPHIVSVNFGNGITEKFEMTLKSEGLSTLKTVSISFKPLDKTGSKLEQISYSTNSGWIYEDGSIYYFDTSDYDFVDFNPERFRLTRQDGTVFILNINKGVEFITDTNGNKITIAKNKISHSNGKAITINRNSQDKITSIVSPTGDTIKYGYDELGNLVSVTDAGGYITQFAYDDNHYLTEIIDTRGISVAKNIYDDNGRLIKTVDADGNEIKYEHDINGREEKIIDRNGGVTRYVYDNIGNILLQTDAMGNVVRNTYDNNGNLATKADAMGNTTNYNYDALGNLLSIIDSEGNTISNQYDSKGLLTSINAMGFNAISLTYDDNGGLLSTQDALGNTINYSYDEKGQITSVTDEIGKYMNVTYDSSGNVTSATNGAGTTVKVTYNAKNNILSKTLSYTTENGLQTITEYYEYDESGNLTKITDSEGNITTTQYNSIGKIEIATDEKGRQTKYNYDTLGNLKTIIYCDGTTESFTYDREGNNLTATDRLGRTVSMTYDKVGNMITKSYPNGAVESYEYDKNYRLIKTTSSSGGVTTYEYDTIGRNTAIVDALGNKVTFAYNEFSQLSSMTDAKGNTHFYEYNLNGTRTKNIFPDGTFVSTAYDARGRITSQTDQNNYTTTYGYDGADRLTSVTDALGNVTSYTYDEIGNLKTITDANGNTTSYEYDKLGRVIKVTNAVGQVSEMTYDECGNIETQTEFGGKLTSYTYDEYDRVETITTADGTTTYQYTIDGKLESVTDKNGVTTFSYTDMDGLSKVVYPDGTYVSYEYDDCNRLSAIITPFGATQYRYDLLDRLTTVIDRNENETTYDYDVNGNRSAVHYPNGITTIYEYDNLNRVISEKSLDKSGIVVVQYNYGLGLAGERLNVQEKNRTVEYSYDKLYRLTGETITENENVTEFSYGYDAVSNRILKTENGVQTNYSYNESNQLISENDTSYEYDLSGNLVKTTSADKISSYVYNAENKLIRATIQTNGVTSVEEYEYDFAGNRISKTSENEQTRYLNDISGSLTMVVAEMHSDGTEKAFFTRGTELISQERGGVISYYLYDGHGSVRALTNTSGIITDTYDFDSWGNLTSQVGNTVNPYLYCGEQFDSATGFYYLRARYMNPSTGTFISMDVYQGSVFDPVSLHKYLYANANPVMYSDPSGYMVDVAGMAILGDGRAQYDASVLKVFHSLMASLKTTVVSYLQTNFVQLVASSISIGTMGAIAFMCADLIMLSSIGDISLGGTQFDNIFVASAWITGMIIIAASDVIASGRQIMPSTAIHHIVQENFWFAKPAQKVLIDSGVDPCIGYSSAKLRIKESLGEPNLVEIKTITHLAIHSQLCNTIYTEWVNIIVTNTPHHSSNGLINYWAVATSLTFIKGTLKAADSIL